MANIRIREAAKAHGVMLWEIAVELGISEASMTRKLRIELNDPERAKILSVIEGIATKKAAG